MDTVARLWDTMGETQAITNNSNEDKRDDRREAR